MDISKPTIFYTVDEEGTILDIGGDWQSFVDKGGVDYPQSMADYNMVGKNLFDFIANETVRDMYRELHRKAMDGQKCEFEYRCDGPDVARVAKLELKAGELGICYTSTILNEVPHDTEGPISVNREKDLLVRMCSVCKAIQIPERGDDWYTLEDYLKRAHIPHTLSQSVCPNCTGVAAD